MLGWGESFLTQGYHHCVDGMPLAKNFIYSELYQYLPREIETTSIKKIPTGIADLDTIVNGGFPSGSTVLLLGDTGAGQQEFVYTSAAKISIVRDNPELRNYFLGETCNQSVLPEKICYVTFARSKEDILLETATSLNREFFTAIKDRTMFKDFSGIYFRRTIVPQSWTHQESPFDSASRDLLESLVDFLEENASNSMVVIDSLTDLVEIEAVEMNDLIATVKGIQRASKKWDGIVYLLLTRGIMEKKYEQMVVNSVDGVLVFEWKNYANSSMRQRYMYVEKFASVLSHLSLQKIARFPTMVTSSQGLVVVYMERIS